MPRQFKKTNGMNNNDFIVYDFETSGLDHNYHHPIQVAAMAINGRKLTPYPNGTYSSLMRPPGKEEDWHIDQIALEVNKKTMEEIRSAPGEEQVWTEFAAFVRKYNPKGNIYGAPISCGQNIKGFDKHWVQVLCQKYKMVDKDGRQNLFNRKNEVDLVDISFMWFENCVEPTDHSLDTLRDFFGIPHTNSHDAGQDILDTWAIIEKFIKLHRRLSPKIPFKGAMLNGNKD